MAPCTRDSVTRWEEPQGKQIEGAQREATFQLRLSTPLEFPQNPRPRRGTHIGRRRQHPGGRRILRTHGEITGRRPIRTKREVASTLSFNPGHVTINSGETLTFEHGDKTQDPHTLTIVNKADLPASSAEVFNCGAPGTVCDDIFQLLPGEPSGPEFLNVAGGSGLDARGDTMFILPGTSVSATVTAAPGSTLYFLCLIHPWMQGTIKVH